MNTTPEKNIKPEEPADGETAGSEAAAGEDLVLGTPRPELHFLLGYMLFPVLALASAAAGVWAVIVGNKIAGVILLVVVVQLFVWGAVRSIGIRKKLVAERMEAVEEFYTGQEAIDRWHAREAERLEAERAQAEREQAEKAQAKQTQAEQTQAEQNKRES